MFRIYWKGFYCDRAAWRCQRVIGPRPCAHASGGPPGDRSWSPRGWELAVTSQRCWGGRRSTHTAGLHPKTLNEAPTKHTSTWSLQHISTWRLLTQLHLKPTSTELVKYSQSSGDYLGLWGHKDHWVLCWLHSPGYHLLLFFLIKTRSCVDSFVFNYNGSRTSVTPWFTTLISNLYDSISNHF